MLDADTEVVSAANEWLSAGHGLTLVTVAKTWGSAPRPVGSLLAVRDDGRMVGSVSGGCVEDDLVERLRKRRPQPGRPEVTTYGVTRDEAGRFGLPCGGRLELVLEAMAPDSNDHTLLGELDAALSRRELHLRHVDLQTGAVTLNAADREQEFRYEENVLEKVFGPRWRLLIIGAGHLSRYVADMAGALGYEIIVCDPRQEFADAWDVCNTVLDRRMPDDVVTALGLDARSAVVALTHDPKLDDMALMVALESDAFYIGALGSRANNAKRRERLATLGLDDAALARLRGPVGLPIGSRTPAEIAVSIAADLTAVRRGAALQAPRILAPVAGSPDEAAVDATASLTAAHR